MHNSEKTHCLNGHPFAGRNLRLCKDGYRYCRACDAERNARRRGCRGEYYRREDVKKRLAERFRERQSDPNQKERLLARYKVRSAVASGKMIRGVCEHPGCSDIKTQGHHDDYSSPLTVRWLCHKHHVAHHYHEKAKSEGGGR